MLIVPSIAVVVLGDAELVHQERSTAKSREERDEHHYEHGLHAYTAIVRRL